MSTSTPSEADIERRLTAFLQSRLGAWPPEQPVQIVVNPDRDLPMWDGSFRPLVGIESPRGTVISCSPTVFPDATAISPLAVEDALGHPDAYMTVPEIFGQPQMHFGRAVFRYVGQPADLPEIGEWIERDDPRVPAWLRPFNGGVLIAWKADGTYAAGVGIKQHNELGAEISVGTDPSSRGKGYARALVAQAARRILERGAIPMYLHGDRNAASSKVADAAGFPDRGWHLIEVR